MTGMLSLHICDALEIEERYRYEILLYALHHDLSEIITGDISTVAKQIIKGNGGEKGVDALDNVFPKIKELQARCKALGMAIVKVADIIDAITFLEIEGVGTHAETVKVRLKLRLQDKIKEHKEKWPIYKWDNAKMVLDELLSGDDLVL